MSQPADHLDTWALFFRRPECRPLLTVLRDATPAEVEQIKEIVSVFLPRFEVSNQTKESQS